MKNSPTSAAKSFRASRGAFRVASGFSLVEVLLATFILGIGMIMVASVFPVGADWTRQTTEDGVAQTIAQNALTVIQRHYSTANPSLLNPDVTAVLGATTVNSVLKSANPFVLQPLPLFPTVVPASERAYQFGSSTPFPAPNPSVCTYFWTALCRLDPSQYDTNYPAVNNVHPSSSYKYDIYILVFHKGAAEQNFTLPFSGYSEIPGMRNEPFTPAVYVGNYYGGDAYNASATPTIQNAVPQIGDIGIGYLSGTVFRQGIYVPTAPPGSNPQASARPALIGEITPTSLPTEKVIFSVPADNTTASPLIYVYQTTISQ